MRRFLLLLAVVYCSSVNLFANDYIALVDGTSLWGKCVSQTDSTINVESTRTRTFKISDIKLIEYEEKGVVIYNPSAIIPAPTRAEGYFGKDCRVYVPFSSSKANQREGCKALRNFLKEQKYWKIVDCEEEANLIVELYIEEYGEDKAFVRVTDRTDAEYYVSEETKAWGNLTDIILSDPWNLNAEMFESVKPRGIGERIAKLLMYSIVEFQNEHNPDIPSVDADEIVNPLAKGNAVYLQAGAEREDVLGTVFLTKLLKKDGFWKIARCPKESHFVIQFRFSDEGPDHAFINILDKKGNIILKSSSVKADEGVEIELAVNKLYRRFILKQQKKQSKKK